MSIYSQCSLRHVALVVLGTLLVAACGDREGRGPGRTGTGKPAVVAAEGRLDILAWPGFARAGDGKANDAWMRSFEKATACEVHVRRVERPEQLLAVADKDGVDLIVAGGETALSLVQAGKVQALDLKRVPAYRGIAPRLAYGAGHVVDGVHYGVPFQWGPLSPAYDQPIRIADAALLIKATRPELRIDDPFALDEAQYAAALAALREQRALPSPSPMSMHGRRKPAFGHRLVRRVHAARQGQASQLRDGLDAVVAAGQDPGAGGREFRQPAGGGGRV